MPTSSHNSFLPSTFGIGMGTFSLKNLGGLVLLGICLRPLVGLSDNPVPVYVNTDGYGLELQNTLQDSTLLERKGFDVKDNNCSRTPCTSNVYILVDVVYINQQYKANIKLLNGRDLLAEQQVSSSSNAALRSKVTQIIPAVYTKGIQTSVTQAVTVVDIPKVVVEPTDTEKPRKKRNRKDKKNVQKSPNDSSVVSKPNSEYTVAQLPNRLSLTTHTVTNDPFLKRRGVGGTYYRNINRHTFLTVSGRYSFDLGESDLTTLTRQIKDDNNVAPDISRVITHAEAGVGYTTRQAKGTLFNGTPVDAFLSFGVNAGLTQTVDDGTVSGILAGADNICPDISTLNSNSEEALFCQTQIQWHPHTSYSAEVTLPIRGTRYFSLVWKGHTYIETVNSTMLEMKNLSFVEVGYGFKL